MMKFKWRPNKKTKLNTTKLTERYLVPGRFKRYNHYEIKDDRERAWVNSKLHEKIAERIKRVRIKATPDITRAYKKHGILPISRILDYPPWILFITITRRRQLNKFDRAQRKLALTHDIGSPLAQKVSKKRADQFENRMIRFFRKNGVCVKDENDLAREQIKKYGRPRWTVDLWFADNPIILNGRKIYWIECKNYILTDNKLFLPSVRKQVLKYKKQWGNGAIAFAKGHTILMRIPGVMVLDAYKFEGKVKRAT